MKRILKKNQMMIAALAVMIAAAGYLNYSGKIFPKEKKAQETGAELANQELLDISEEDLEAKTGFRITGHTLEFSGICPECRKSNGL